MREAYRGCNDFDVIIIACAFYVTAGLTIFFFNTILMTAGANRKFLHTLHHKLGNYTTCAGHTAVDQRLWLTVISRERPKVTPT